MSSSLDQKWVRRDVCRIWFFVFSKTDRDTCTHTLNNHRACSEATFLSLAQRWRLDQDMSEVSTNPGTDDRCIIVPLEDSVRLTPEQAIYRGEFFASEENCTCNQPLVMLLPVATSRVRLVCFDAITDCHSDSDIENV